MAISRQDVVWVDPKPTTQRGDESALASDGPEVIPFGASEPGHFSVRAPDL